MVPEERCTGAAAALIGLSSTDDRQVRKLEELSTLLFRAAAAHLKTSPASTALVITRDYYILLKL